MYWIGGPDGMVSFYTDPNGYVVTVIGERVGINASPLIITPQPPIGPISEVNFGTLYQDLMAALKGA